MTAITRNRELSQFGSFIYVDDSNQNVAITTDSSRFVGIGSTVPTSKLVVGGDVNVSGVITALSFTGSSFIGTATNATDAVYAEVSGLSTVALGIATNSNINTSGIITASSFVGNITNASNAVYAQVSGLSTVSVSIQPTSSVNTSGIITASAFYVNDVLLINPEFSTWSYTGSAGIGNTIYRLGNVGIGISVGINEKLVVDGNVSASRYTSTVASGTAPFTVNSNTLVTNLNADFLRGKLAPSGDIVGTTDTQTLTNKTLTTPTVGSGGITFNGTSGSTNLGASTTASGTLTLPAETGTLVSTASVGVVTSGNILNGTILNEDINASAGIAVSKLASSTISGITLGNNLNSLSFGSYLTSTSSYNGSSAVSVSVAATTANTGNTVVARNESGDFSAGSINCSYLTASFTVEAQNYITTSDLNLKTNVNTIENSLDIVNSLRGVSFDWKVNGNKSYGVIAQELEEILPDLVTTKENKSVNYNGLVGVLLQAVKELSAEVEELKKKIQ